MLYIHETADNVDFYPESYLISVSLKGSFFIEKANDKEFFFHVPEAFFKIQNLGQLNHIKLNAPVFKTEKEIKDLLKGIKEMRFIERSQTLELSYKVFSVSISAETRKKSYSFHESEIKFNAELTKIVEKNVEKWQDFKRIELGENAALNILLNLAANQDLKELRNANHQ